LLLGRIPNAWGARGPGGKDRRVRRGPRTLLWPRWPGSPAAVTESLTAARTYLSVATRQLRGPLGYALTDRAIRDVFGPEVLLAALRDA